MPSLNTKLATAPNVSANYVLKATTSTTIGNSLIFDNGTSIGINTTSPTGQASNNTALQIVGAGTGNRAQIKLTNSVSGATGTDGLMLSYDDQLDGYLYNFENGGLILGTNNAVRLNITSAGYLNIANNTAQLLPISAGNFQILGGMYYNGSNLIASNGDGGRILFSGGNFQFNTFTGATIGNSVSDTERMRISSNGNVGIGTSSPAAKLHVDGNQYVTNGTVFCDTFSSYSGGSTSTSINFGGSGSLLFNQGSSERVRITSFTKITNGGAFLGGSYHEFVNSTSNNYITTFNNTSGNPYGLYIVYPNSSPNSGSTNEFIWCVDSTNSKFIVWSNGTASNRTGTYGTISSDLRLKENIVEATSKLNDILKLRVVNFNLKDDTDKKKQIGFIAQEFKEVFPSLVYEKDTREYDDNGNVTKGLEDSLGLNVGMEFAILVKAIQEQQAQIEAQQQTINSLINR